MQIHTVTKIDTLYTIARKYSIPATKILADNDLAGDRLTIGDELIILKPTKTVTVKGGDTLDLISKKYPRKNNEIKKTKIIPKKKSFWPPSLSKKNFIIESWRQKSTIHNKTNEKDIYDKLTTFL